MAKAIGARVVTTVGNEDKAKVCRKLGAGLAINYKTDDIDGALGRFAPDGIDVWFETLREQNLERAVEHLAMRGRLVLIAGRDSQPKFPVGPFHTKDCTIYGFALFNTPPEEQRKCAAEMNRWMAKGRLKAHIDRVMRLSDAAAAHRLQEENTLGNAGTLAGKIVLTP